MRPKQEFNTRNTMTKQMHFIPHSRMAEYLNSFPASTLDQIERECDKQGASVKATYLRPSENPLGFYLVKLEGNPPSEAWILEHWANSFAKDHPIYWM